MHGAKMLKEAFQRRPTEESTLKKQAYNNYLDSMQEHLNKNI
jgi:hypothetical protein